MKIRYLKEYPREEREAIIKDLGDALPNFHEGEVNIDTTTVLWLIEQGTVTSLLLLA